MLVLAFANEAFSFEELVSIRPPYLQSTESDVSSKIARYEATPLRHVGVAPQLTLNEKK